ncbi:carbohydrate ABC transporter permease [Salinibacterium sp. NG253]|uniref:carbohydrate ABC transporter permease n=1 Tax=Salinibacterium sp. NG253 TaxID=2792039 RepID=UPI0018CF2D46|nr:carbohydrate ABC transporter permease [Salinibacterium sp. NG253]MBH0117434.1 carbohydrate ABC transporter permease [Salinibacterium sp. NG253]
MTTHSSSAAPVTRPAGRPFKRAFAGRVRWWTYAFLIASVFMSAFPLYWMFVVSTNDSAAVSQTPPTILPGGNFFALAEQVFTTVPFVQSLANSFIVAGSIAIAQMILSTLAGFAFAKLQFRGRDPLFIVVLITMMVPTQLAVIPLYMIMSNLDWIDSLQALIVPGMASAFGIFWMRQHLSTVLNNELMQAARIDGCSTWQIYWRIAFPLVRSAAFVLGLLAFVTAWNDFLWPLIVIQSPENYTVQLAIKALQRQYFVDYGLAMSGSFLATIPLLILFIFVGRKMVAGVMDGAFKG